MGPFILAAVFAFGAVAGAQDVKEIARGRKIFAAQGCAKCHMVAGKGNKMLPLDGVGSKLPAADITKWFTHTAAMEAALPKKPAIMMSAKKYNFKDADLDALVAYLASLK